MPAMDGTGPYGNGPTDFYRRGNCGNPRWRAMGACYRGLGSGYGLNRMQSFGPGRGLGWFNAGAEDYTKDIKAALKARAEMLKRELEYTESILSQENQKENSD